MIKITNNSRQQICQIFKNSKFKNRSSPVYDNCNNARETGFPVNRDDDTIFHLYHDLKELFCLIALKDMRHSFQNLFQSCSILQCLSICTKIVSIIAEYVLLLFLLFCWCFFLDFKTLFDYETTV